MVLYIRHAHHRLISLAGLPLFTQQPPQEAEASYQSVMVGLRAKQAELASLMEALARLEDELGRNIRERERLEGEVRGVGDVR